MPTSVARMPIIRPAEPVITPAERSNSPPIISSATDHRQDARWSRRRRSSCAMPSSCRNSALCVQKKIATTIAAEQRADLRPPQEARRRADVRQALVRGGRGGAASRGGRLALPPRSTSARAAAGRRRRPDGRVLSACRPRPASATVSRVRLVDEARAGEDRQAAADGVGVGLVQRTGTRPAGSPAGTAAGRRRTAIVAVLDALMTSPD